MDAGDMAVNSRMMHNRNLQRKDPLDGYDICKEYAKIEEGKSTLCLRIKQLVIQRYTTGQ